jgi:MFS family permease
MGLIFPNFQAMAANAVQPHEQGAAAGTLSAAQGLGMVLGPIAGTLLYRVSPALPYLLVGAGLWALALFSFVRLQRATTA